MVVNKQGAAIKSDKKGDSKTLMRSAVASINSNRSKGKSNSPQGAHGAKRKLEDGKEKAAAKSAEKSDV